jgi:hypothetical protein
MAANILDEYSYPNKHEIHIINDLLDTLLRLLRDGALADHPGIELLTRQEFAYLGVDIEEEAP